MLTIVWGPAGSGKSHALLEELTVRAAEGIRRQYLLVPEQFSHENERLLCKQGGKAISLMAETLTFRRLSDRVLAESGGAPPVLDEGGRLLALSQAVGAVRDDLRSLRAQAGSAAFLPRLLETVDELKSYGVGPDELSLASRAADEPLAGRYYDLSLILTAYDAVLSGSGCDPRDRLALAAARLERSAYVDAQWFVDGFVRFTVREKDVLAALVARTDVTVALTGVPIGGENTFGRFAAANRTADELRRMAERTGAPVRKRVMDAAPRYKNGVLAHLSRHLLSGSPAAFDGPTEGLSLISLPDMRLECEQAACLVRMLTRDHGYRYRDIAVVARHFEEYRPIFEQVAKSYELPLFLDSVEDLLNKPLPGFVSAALSVVCRNYPRDMMLYLLKTGLFGLSADECDALENYMLAYDIRGSSWRVEKGWAYHPRGYGQPFTPEDGEELERLNALRRRVIEPLETLRREARAQRTYRGYAMALYRFMEAIGLPERLRARCDALQAAGAAKTAAEYAQLWDILTKALEQCVQLLGDRPAEFSHFSELFTLVLSQYKVGAIPTSLDHLICGSADRIRSRTPRCVILLGCTDASFPSVQPSSGLLRDDDRAFLRECGWELAPTQEERLDQEADILYGALTLPSERLYVLWPRLGPEGEEMHPAFVTDDLIDMTGAAPLVLSDGEAEMAIDAPSPCLQWLAGGPAGPLAAAARACMEALPGWDGRLRALERAARFPRGLLSGEAARALYGPSATLSASRVETFMNCRYAYFLQYGLRAAPRRADGFAPYDRGNFVHDVLEKTTRAVMDRGGFAAVTDEQVRHLARSCAERYVKDMLFSHEGQTARFRGLMGRLMKAIDAVASNVAAELRCSEFEPLDVELRFSDSEPDALPAARAGRSVRVTGAVDRVDGWIEDGTLYVRVVDYKTGRQAFKLGDVWHGLNMQMLLYLFALETEGLARYRALGARRIVPAGALYLPARELYLQAGRDIADEELAHQMSRALLRSGLILDDPRVIEAMEPGVSGEGTYIPVKFKADGELSPLSSVASAERLGRLKRHVDKLLEEMEDALRAGDVSANPVCRGAKSACETCKFVMACQFRQSPGDRPRYVGALTPGAFWKRLEEEALL